jgi:hypothetical protein
MQIFDSYDFFLVTGAFGSGKTEFAINLAIKLAEKRSSVNLADLDIVNMYFRSRQRTEQLKEEYGIEVISSAEGMQHADIPALSAGFAGAMAAGQTLVFDIGGDKAGATVMGRFRQLLQARKAKCLLIQVFNPYRPYADSVVKIRSLMNQIEECIGLQTGLLVANPHLGMSTVPDTINSVLPFIEQVQTEINLPLLLSKNSNMELNLPDMEIFNLQRFMKLPFEAGAFASI